MLITEGKGLISFDAELRHTNRYGWHISLKRKFTQISRHLFETHKIRLVTVKVVVAVRQHAKQTNKKLAHTAYVPERGINHLPTKTIVQD